MITSVQLYSSIQQSHVPQYDAGPLKLTCNSYRKKKPYFNYLKLQIQGVS